MKTFSFRGVLTTCLCFFYGVVQAQENFSVYNEPAFSVKIATETPWSYKFGIAHRRLAYEAEEYLFVAENIEISHSTHYKVENFGKLGLGVKYKFYELFDETSHDELRITQEYSRSGKISTFEIGHRFRLEERFEEITSLRTRYKLSVEIPLSNEAVTENGLALELATETLFSVANGIAPELDQRVGANVIKDFWENWAFEIGVEYQYENYNHDPEAELFLLTEISVSL